MSPEYPIHVMIKPEGLDLFPDYLRSQVEALEAVCGKGSFRRVLITLTPDEVEMIYPGDAAPEIFKQYISSHPTEHYFFQGEEGVYLQAKAMKGKYGQPTGIRTAVSKGAEKAGVKLERWQNFIHSSDDVFEAHRICKHLSSDNTPCKNCQGKSLCKED